MSIGILISFWDLAFIILGMYSEVVLLGHKVILRLIEETSFEV
jgi:hypothetical protein